MTPRFSFLTNQADRRQRPHAACPLLGAALLLLATATSGVEAQAPAVDNNEEVPKIAPVALGGARLMVTLGAATYQPIGVGDGTGSGQLQAARYGRPKVGLHAGLEVHQSIGPYLRLGGAIGFDWTRRERRLDFATDPELTSLRLAYGEGVLVVAQRWAAGSRTHVEVGGRATIGGGVARWWLNDDVETAPLWRGSIGAHLALLRGRDAASGLAAHFGYAHLRTAGMGPLDLRFTFAGAFFDIGFVHGW